ncbi:MAG: hypothetical protein ACPG05_05600, partial [Bdellovibrionales bacterium]
IQDLSLVDRCLLIRQILDENPTHYKGNSSAIKTSLVRLGSSFEISEDFYDWLDMKRRTLLKALKKPRNKDILRGFSSWDSISTEEQKHLLQKSSRLHIKTHMEGIASVMPFQHIFEEGTTVRTKGGINVVYGGFRASLNPNHGTIVNYTYNNKLQYNALDAFDTSHHEVTHFIQHHFAVSVFNGAISRKHPFFDESSYFLALTTQKAYIPSIYGTAYRWQPYEIMADREGGRISSGIQALSL